MTEPAAARSRAVGVTLAVVVLGALAIRLVPRWGEVFAPDGLRLGDPDGWHHVRQIEQWARHFPHRMRHDPFALHPQGQETPTAPLFDAICAAIAWAVGLGAPVTATVERVAATLPALFGALTCVPVARIARRVGGDAAGLVAAFVVAAAPGQMLGRSLVGFADHHALEALLAAMALACVCAVADARRGEALDATCRPSRARAVALAGIAVALYLLAWSGGALVVAVLAAASVVAAATTPRTVADGWGTGLAFVFVVAAAAVAPFAGSFPTGPLAIGACVGAASAVIVAAWVVRGLRARGVHEAAAVVASVLAPVALAALAARLVPGVGGAVAGAFGWFDPTAERVTVAEARPLLLGDDGTLRWSALGAEFGTPLLAAVVGAVVVARRLVRERRGSDAIVAVAALAFGAAALAQSRFAPYATIAVAVLAGAALGPALARLAHAAGTPRWLGRGVWPATVACALVVPTVPYMTAVLRAPGTLDAAWRDALVFLRDETPEPFDDPGAFEARESGPPTPSASGVIAWWDAGYGITQIARRAPVANPTQAGAPEVARVLLATDPADAASMCDSLSAPHLVLDSNLALLPAGGVVAGRVASIAPWAGRRAEDYVREFRYVREGRETRTLLLFLPEYFRTTVARLVVFAGDAAPAGRVHAVVWRAAADGVPEVVESKEFRHADAAERWVRERRATAPETDHVVWGSLDPLVPPVPLEAVTQFRRVHASSTVAPLRREPAIPDVQVWERVP